MARREHDFYPTPQPLCDAVCKRLAEILPAPTYIIEPSAGSGNFVRAARPTWSKIPIYALDVREECREQCKSAGADDFILHDWPSFVECYDLQPGGLILGNPPFNQAKDHILATLPRLKGHLAFLLKANFLGGEDRAKTLWSQPGLRFYIPICGRPSFIQTEKATNGFEEYGIYIWQSEYNWRPEILLPHIFWR